MAAVLDVLSDVILSVLDAVFARKTDKRSGGSGRKGKRHGGK